MADLASRQDTTPVITTVEVKYRVVTPIFCGGSNPKETAELRLPSLKGVLRYWWRALAWSEFGGDVNRVHSEEAKLFGGSSKDTGQSRAVMRLVGSTAGKQIDAGALLQVPGRNQAVGHGVRYLGFGAVAASGKLDRPCLAAPFDFTVHIRLRNAAEEQLDMLRRALIVMGLVGGMGAKSRKGFGSLNLVSLKVDGVERWSAPIDVAGLQAALAEELGRSSRGGCPDWTAFSSQSRCLLLSAGQVPPLELLDRVGREMVRYRSYGDRGTIFGSERVEAERNFASDHDLVLDAPKNERLRGHPERIAFGLPHNYYFKSLRLRASVKPSHREIDRRASPLFIHIHQCGETPVAVVLFLPAVFLPSKRSDISVQGRRAPLAPVSELYRPVVGWLDRLLDSGKRREPFEWVTEVSA